MATFYFSVVLIDERQFRLGFDPAEFFSELTDRPVFMDRT